MTTWRLPTKRDALEPSAGNPTMRCERCARRVPADMLVNVRALPVALRGSATHLCDACTDALIRTGTIAREDLTRLCGAPDGAVTAAKVWALAHDPIRKTKPVIPLPSP